MSDLKNYTFLDNTTRPKISKNWMQKSKINRKEIKILGFEHFFMIIEAAEHNLGVGLVPKFLVKTELQNGSLINPLRIHYKTGFNYYLLYPKINNKQKLIDEFANHIKNLV